MFKEPNRLTSPIVPKTSFFNIPLLIALLITSIVHLGVIANISLDFSKKPLQKNSKTIDVTLKRVQPVAPTAVPNKPEVVVPPKAETEIPVVQPRQKHAHQSVQPNVSSARKSARTKRAHVDQTSAHQIHRVKKPARKPVVADNTTKPVLTEPEKIPVEAVVEEPAPAPKVETPAIVTEPVTPAVNKPEEVVKTDAVVDAVQPEVIDNLVDVPVKKANKSAKKVGKKAVKKSHKKTSAATNDNQPTLSMDDLTAQIAQVGEKFGNQAPSVSESRIKPLSSVREHKASARQYKQDWRVKIERIANLNFPEAARQKDFSARLVLEVGINADGSLHSLKIKKSSGTPALDEAAKNIIQLGAPFAALPKDLAEELDVLILQQPMQFSDEGGAVAQ